MEIYTTTTMLQFSLRSTIILLWKPKPPQPPLCTHTMPTTAHPLPFANTYSEVIRSTSIRLVVQRSKWKCIETNIHNRAAETYSSNEWSLAPRVSCIQGRAWRGGYFERPSHLYEDVESWKDMVVFGWALPRRCTWYPFVPWTWVRRGSRYKGGLRIIWPQNIFQSISKWIHICYESQRIFTLRLLYHDRMIDWILTSLLLFETDRYV